MPVGSSRRAVASQVVGVLLPAQAPGVKLRDFGTRGQAVAQACRSSDLCAGRHGSPVEVDGVAVQDCCAFQLVGDTEIESLTSSVSGINPVLSTPPLSTKTVRRCPLMCPHIRGRCQVISQSPRDPNTRARHPWAFHRCPIRYRGPHPLPPANRSPYPERPAQCRFPDHASIMRRASNQMRRLRATVSPTDASN